MTSENLTRWIVQKFGEESAANVIGTLVTILITAENECPLADEAMDTLIGFGNMAKKIVKAGEKQ